MNLTFLSAFEKKFLILILSNIYQLHEPLLTDPPTSLSAVHTIPTTITVYWSPPTTGTTGYEITYFAGAGDTTGTTVVITDGSTSSREITGLSSTVTYTVSIVSVAGTSRSDTTGPVLAARGEYVHSLYNILH